ncbi:prepilin-type N-terminal cleavage/methylation domain-containing protein [Terrimicrobium sacchariphilum]|uniref:Prepilin-type N-terminal cleavage/methylation domain-containing protein n=1 Tax=Terrimicrobium sacchariphilum TaxID=690879 RepID=A0A146G924_TERSA|nr:prepilin-type N-terminal cleavage/methylation domain-containing protein [Terrimicrobium sacchariphilum]GAT33971.1 prepilin-type N-terminal cleavage/methylation domain-containing protein [Terrimicrobium sacchariphilum]
MTKARPFTLLCCALLSAAALPTLNAADIVNTDIPLTMDTEGQTYVFNDGYVVMFGGDNTELIDSKPNANYNPDPALRGDPVIGKTNGGVTLRITDGSQVTLGFLNKSGDGLGGSSGWRRMYIGSAPSSAENSLLVSGQSTVLNATNISMLSVGGHGSNNLFAVTDGALASMGRIAASYFAGSTNNVVRVSGTVVSKSDPNKIVRSTIQTTSPTLLGYYGSGARLEVTDGGQFLGGNRVYIGFRGSLNDPNSAGTGGGHSALVSGEGSLLSAYGDAGFVSVGNAGDNNSLRIENGGKVSSVGAYIGTGGGVNDGLQTGGQNTATITGAGSIWEITNYYNTETGEVSAGDFFVGKAGSGNKLEILNGGTVFNPNNMHIGGNGSLSDGKTVIATHDNSVWVSGANSILENQGDVNVGSLLLGTGTESVPGVYSTSTLSVMDKSLVMVGSVVSESAVLNIAQGSSVQINGGFLALYGDLSLSDSYLYSLISEEKFSIFTEEGNWITATAADFTITYIEEGEDSGSSTGGLYSSLGGYTIVASTYVVPEPGVVALLTLGLVLIVVRLWRKPKKETVLSCCCLKPTSRPSLLDRGFSMVEVLISMGIVVVLTSLVLGASGPMMQRVASLQSVSNLRQFGLAYARFAAENDGKIPPTVCNLKDPSDFGTTAYGKSWDYWLLPYLGYEVGAGIGNLTESNTPKGPAVEKLFLHGADKNTSSKTGSRRTYASNVYNAPIAQTIQGKPMSWMRTSYLQTLSQRILLTEFPYTSARIGRSSFAGVTPGLQISLTAGKPDLNAGGKFNYLFGDGHVETLALEDTYTAEDDYKAEPGGPKPPQGRGKMNLWANPNGAGCPCGCGGTGGV